MAFGFQSKNDAGNFIITDQTINLTFFKKVINYDSISIPFTGFGNSTEIRYKVTNCTSTPVPFFTMPVQGKAYSCLKVTGPVGANNEWTVTLLTNQRPIDTPTSTDPTTAFVPLAGFNNLDEVAAAIEDEENDRIFAPTSSATSQIGAVAIIPENYSAQYELYGLDRGGYAVMCDMAHYNTRTTDHMPFKMGAVDPNKRYYFTNVNRAGTACSIQEFEGKTNSNASYYGTGDGGTLAIYQFNGGSTDFWNTGSGVVGPRMSEGVIPAAPQYATDNPFVEGAVRHPFAVNTAGFSFSRYDSSANRTQLYTTKYAYDMIVVGQYCYYYKYISTDANTPTGTGWLEILAKSTDGSNQFFIEVAGDIPAYGDNNKGLGSETNRWANANTVGYTGSNRSNMSDPVGTTAGNRKYHHHIGEAGHWYWGGIFVRGWPSSTFTLDYDDTNNGSAITYDTTSTTHNIDFFPLQLDGSPTTRYWDMNPYQSMDPARDTNPNNPEGAISHQLTMRTFKDARHGYTDDSNLTTVSYTPPTFNATAIQVDADAPINETAINLYRLGDYVDEDHRAAPWIVPKAKQWPFHMSVPSNSNFRSTVVSIKLYAEGEGRDDHALDYYVEHAMDTDALLSGGSSYHTLHYNSDASEQDSLGSVCWKLAGRSTSTGASLTNVSARAQISNLDRSTYQPADFDTPKEFTVTVDSDDRYVVSPGGTGYYQGDTHAYGGVGGSPYNLLPGKTYRFLQSDSSNTGKQLRASLSNFGPYTDSSDVRYQSSHSDYTTGITYVGTAGQSGAYTQIKLPIDSPIVKIYLYMDNANVTHGTPTFAGHLTVRFVTFPYKNCITFDSAAVLTYNNIGDSTPNTGVFKGGPITTQIAGLKEDIIPVLSMPHYTVRDASGSNAFTNSGGVLAVYANNYNDGFFGYSQVRGALIGDLNSSTTTGKYKVTEILDLQSVISTPANTYLSMSAVPSVSNVTLTQSSDFNSQRYSYGSNYNYTDLSVQCKLPDITVAPTANASATNQYAVLQIKVVGKDYDGTAFTKYVNQRIYPASTSGATGHVHRETLMFNLGSDLVAWKRPAFPGHADWSEPNYMSFSHGVQGFEFNRLDIDRPDEMYESGYRWFLGMTANNQTLTQYMDRSRWWQFWEFDGFAQDRSTRSYHSTAGTFGKYQNDFITLTLLDIPENTDPTNSNYTYQFQEWNTTLSYWETVQETGASYYLFNLKNPNPVGNGDATAHGGGTREFRCQIRAGGTSGAIKRVVYQTLNFHGFPERRTIYLRKWIKNSWESANSPSSWIHSGFSETPDILQTAHRQWVPGVRVWQGSIDNIKGYNTQPYYMTGAQSNCETWRTTFNLEPIGGSPYAGGHMSFGVHFNYRPPSPYGGYYSAFTNTSTNLPVIEGNLNSSIGHHGHVWYTSFTEPVLTGSALGFWDQTRNALYSKILVPQRLADNAIIGPGGNAGGTHGSNGGYWSVTGIDDSDSTITLDELLVEGYGFRCFIKASYGHLDRAATYTEALVWNGEIIATNAANTNNSLASSITVGNNTYTIENINSSFSKGPFILSKVKKFGPYDPADYPPPEDPEAGFTHLNIPSLYIFTDPALAQAPTTDYGLQVIQDDGSTVSFDSRLNPLMLNDSRDCDWPSSAVTGVHGQSAGQGTNGMSAKSFDSASNANFSNLFTPNRTKTITGLDSSGMTTPAYFLNSSVQCAEDTLREKKYTKDYGTNKYYYDMLYWALYKGGIRKESNNTHKAQFIAVNKGRYRSIIKADGFVNAWIGLNADRKTSGGTHPYNNETLDDENTQVLLIEGNSYDGNTYTVTLDVVSDGGTGNKVQVTGTDRNGTFVSQDQKTISIRTGDTLVMNVLTSNAQANLHNVIGYLIKTSATTSSATTSLVLNEEAIGNGDGHVKSGGVIRFCPSTAGTYYYANDVDNTAQLVGQISVVSANG